LDSHLVPAGEEAAAAVAYADAMIDTTQRDQRIDLVVALALFTAGALSQHPPRDLGPWWRRHRDHGPAGVAAVG
jgi:hypothetical protein